jgi:hypothetical protein
MKSNPCIIMAILARSLNDILCSCFPDHPVAYYS